MKGHILIVDDDQSMCEMLEADFLRRGLSVKWTTSAEDAFSTLKCEDFNVILADINMPGISGVELCKRSVESRPDIPVVIMTAFGSLDTAIASIRAGAYDFIAKPFEPDILAISIERAINHNVLQNTLKLLSKSVQKSQQFEELIGNSSVMQKLFFKMTKIAETETSVLISGESGSGKELVARALHIKSRRKDKPFIAINCSALPDTLLESELFGHKRGAFTDAKSDRKGLFLAAHGGTLFLDEIGEISRELQPKLLRVLEERSVRPIGSTSERSFDVRILSATNQDLEAAIEEGTFREDLYYRLNVIQLRVPSLRERETDILLLAKHFVKELALSNEKKVRGISEPAAKKLMSYPWPGNVRELKNAIEHAVALTSYEKISVDDLPRKIRKYNTHFIRIESHNPADLEPLAEVEKKYIQYVLKTVGGNRTRAAQILCMDRKTLYRKLQQFNETSSHN